MDHCSWPVIFFFQIRYYKTLFCAKISTISSRLFNVISIIITKIIFFFNLIALLNLLLLLLIFFFFVCDY